MILFSQSRSICSWCMFVSSFVLESSSVAMKVKSSQRVYSSCSFLLVLVCRQGKGVPSSGYRECPACIHQQRLPGKAKVGINHDTSHAKFCKGEGTLFLTSLFISSKSWQGVALFEILCPQLFVSSRLPRHEFKREVAPSPALHCSCSFMAIQYKYNPGFKGLVCICLQPAPMHMPSWIWRWSSSHL